VPGSDEQQATYLEAWTLLQTRLAGAVEPFASGRTLRRCVRAAAAAGRNAPFHRYLRAHKFDAEKAVTGLLETVKWRREFGADSLVRQRRLPPLACVRHTHRHV
jgi:hypothetical protein